MCHLNLHEIIQGVDTGDADLRVRIWIFEESHYAIR